MFRSTQPLLAFDYFRVPYDVDPGLEISPGPDMTGIRWARLTPSAGAGRPVLVWPVLEGAQPAVAGRVVRFRMGDLVLHGHVLPDHLLDAALTGSDRSWRRAEELRAEDGGVLASVRRSSGGDIALPFDPDEIITRFWSERYVDPADTGTGSGAMAVAVRAYYIVRPVLPRPLQIALRRAASRIQRRRTFPRWPVEESLHGFFDLVLQWAATLAGRPVPWLAPWPEGRSWALVLTHDVETEVGVRQIPVLRDVDRRAAHRASWNLVPGRYTVDDALVADLQRSGQEVGIHGLLHDGRDLDPRELPGRLPEMRRWAERWGAVGFRSPATHRDWDVMSTLPFEYDSSSPDSDPFEPQAGGCCSWLPFSNGPVVELPITLPQDHTLFVILRARDGQPWIDKAELIRARGGLALLITHPDYAFQGPVLAAYEQLLAHFATDPSVWRPLPAEVSGWWRRRAESSVDWDGSAWRVVGAAAGEAAICFTAPLAGPTASQPGRHASVQAAPSVRPTADPVGTTRGGARNG